MSKEDNLNIESNSIASQRKIINQYVNNNEDMEIFDYYIDDGYSGTNFKRPEFKRMITDVTNGKANVVIVKDLSRFGRNHIEVDTYLENLFPLMNIRFISILDGYDTLNEEDVMDNYFVPVKNLMNDVYSKEISKKVKSVVRMKKMSGEYLSPSALYGYQKDEKDKHKLIIDEEAAKNVEYIFKSILNGKAPSEIAYNLTKKNILVPSEYGKNIENKVPKEWNRKMIYRILRNESYIEDLIQGKKKSQSYRTHKLVDTDKEEWIITKEHHKAIISKSDFEKVQKLLENQNAKTNEYGMVDLFYGYLVCNECGGSFRKSQKYYYCNTYSRTKECSKHSVNRDKLIKYVLEDINKEKNKNLRKLDRNVLFKLIDSIVIYEDGRTIVKYKN